MHDRRTMQSVAGGCTYRAACRFDPRGTCTGGTCGCVSGYAPSIGGLCASTMPTCATIADDVEALLACSPYDRAAFLGPAACGQLEVPMGDPCYAAARDLLACVALNAAGALACDPMNSSGSGTAFTGRACGYEVRVLAACIDAPPPPPSTCADLADEVERVLMCPGFVRSAFLASDECGGIEVASGAPCYAESQAMLACFGSDVSATFGCDGMSMSRSGAGVRFPSPCQAELDAIMSCLMP